MAEPLIIRGGHIVDPSTGFDEPGDVVVRDGRVVSVGGDSTLPHGTELPAEGLIVCPGFVDLHTHLRYPGFPAKEDIASGTAAAAAGGFTTVCAMANTDPPIDSIEVMQSVADEVARASRVHVRQVAAVSLGLLGRKLSDMEALSAAGAVAFSDDGKPVWNGPLMEAALRLSARLNKPISVHEEDPEVVKGGVANAGDRAMRLRLPPWPCRGEALMLRRDVDLLRRIGGHLHVAHVSCAETVDVLRRARADGLHVTGEATPHHLVLDDSLLEGDPLGSLPPRHPCAKVNPPLRSPADVKALVAALADGTIQAIATDHAPHAAQDKHGSFEDAAFGFTGIELALPLTLQLVTAGRMSLSTAIDRLTRGPARIFGLQAGTLRPGSPADICVFDPAERWLVAPDSLRSRGKNSPLIDRQVSGRVRWTMLGGRIVHGVMPGATVS